MDPMARLRRSSRTPVDPGALTGPVRLVRRRSDLDALRNGDVAVVDMPDLDAREARSLVDHGVVAVLNVAPSASGRVPNRGPSILDSAGVVVVDLPSDDAWSRLKSGETVRIDDEGTVLRGDEALLSGHRLDGEHSRALLAEAESNLVNRLGSLTANATDHIQHEQAMLLDSARVPHLRTRTRHRPAVVVSHGFDAAADLAALRRFIATNDPVLIGAGAGADLLIAAGYTPDLLVGSVENLSDRALRTSGEVVVTTGSGRVEGLERLERHGKEIVTFVSTGSDDDLAIVLADTNDASLIVHAGGPPTLIDLLERPAAEASRLVVAKLRAAAKIVDAKAAAQLAPKPMSAWPLLLLVVMGLIAVAVAISVTPTGQDWVGQVVDAVGLGDTFDTGRNAIGPLTSVLTKGLSS